MQLPSAAELCAAGESVAAVSSFPKISTARDSCSIEANTSVSRCVTILASLRSIKQCIFVC